MGLFGNLFDFNGDGELDTLEKAAEFGAFMQMLEFEENDTDNENENEDF